MCLRLNLPGCNHGIYDIKHSLIEAPIVGKITKSHYCSSLSLDAWTVRSTRNTTVPALVAVRLCPPVSDTLSRIGLFSSNLLEVPRSLKYPTIQYSVFSNLRAAKLR